MSEGKGVVRTLRVLSALWSVALFYTTIPLYILTHDKGSIFSWFIFIVCVFLGHGFGLFVVKYGHWKLLVPLPSAGIILRGYLVHMRDHYFMAEVFYMSTMWFFSVLVVRHQLVRHLFPKRDWDNMYHLLRADQARVFLFFVVESLLRGFPINVHYGDIACHIYPHLMSFLIMAVTCYAFVVFDRPVDSDSNYSVGYSPLSRHAELAVWGGVAYIGVSTLYLAW